MTEINWRNSAGRHAAYGPSAPDPFALIPNADDGEYADTELETPQQRERRRTSPTGAEEKEA